jgi:hypothetical protein
MVLHLFQVLHLRLLFYSDFRYLVRSSIPNLIRTTLPDLHHPQGLHHLILHPSGLGLNVLQLPQFLVSCFWEMKVSFVTHLLW